MEVKGKKIGFVLTGSFCTFGKTIPKMKELQKAGADIIPIMSYNSYNFDTKFGKAELFLDLAGDNDRLGVGSFSSNSQLFRFDSDGNGFVDKNDTYFDK